MIFNSTIFRLDFFSTSKTTFLNLIFSPSLGIRPDDVVKVSESGINRREDVERISDAGFDAVSSGSKTLKDAINEAIRDWVSNVRTTYYMIGSVVGMHPYTKIERYFQCVIGRETKKQIQAYQHQPQLNSQHLQNL